MSVCEAWSNSTLICAQKLTSSSITGHFDSLYHSFENVNKSDGMTHD